jgi:biotin carboxyl carrier protein
MADIGDAASESQRGDTPETDEQLPVGCVPVYASVSGNVWRIVAANGDRVSVGDTILILESMKTEIPITAGTNGTVVELKTAERKAVRSGQIIAVIRSES